MKRTILYLDDEAACLNLLRDTLSEDYEVGTASTREEVARRVQSIKAGGLWKLV